MRILSVGNMYPPHHLGGYELMWRSGVGYLRERGHAVRVLTTDFRLADPDPTIPEDPDAHRELRWYWRDHEFPRLSLPERLALERHNREVLSRHLRDVRPDVVSWWAMGGMSLSLIERVRHLGLPAVGFVHDDWMLYGPKVDAWQRALARLGALGPAVGLLVRVRPVRDLGGAARWVFVSETCRRRAAEGWHLPDSAVAHSGIDASLFRAAPERSEWRGGLLYVGRIDSRKGIETAVRALTHLASSTLTVVGSGDDAYLAALRQLVDELELRGRVEFVTPYRDELPGIYADADAVVFPVQWEEPWGLVPLEAMAVGVPVVATGRGGSGEYLRDGDNCLIYRPDADAGALADAVRRLESDPALRRRLRDGGFATAQRFTEDHFDRAVAAALESVAQARHGV